MTKEINIGGKVLSVKQTSWVPKSSDVKNALKASSDNEDLKKIISALADK
ncbi:MAG: hypothetical protein Ta2E_08520 [Mycoplasmoidaceae bacterium]|nr:MAG: hypothetical protein Ta2E_08520 [Mycoplasmoidaceae bacterium]